MEHAWARREGLGYDTCSRCGCSRISHLSTLCGVDGATPKETAKKHLLSCLEHYAHTGGCTCRPDYDRCRACKAWAGKVFDELHLGDLLDLALNSESDRDPADKA